AVLGKYRTVDSVRLITPMFTEDIDTNKSAGLFVPLINQKQRHYGMNSEPFALTLHCPLSKNSPVNEGEKKEKPSDTPSLALVLRLEAMVNEFGLQLIIIDSHNNEK
ncbi:MAG: hypothetical protein K2X39_04100, partial [Silvanigrellaceae bacterium]|nr:hypothetical protein [Silvanigrellaceae bacterium]